MLFFFSFVKSSVFSAHRIIFSTPQIRYICLLGVDYRSLRYIQPPQDLSSDICHETPYVKSSAIYLASAIHLLLFETHPSFWNRILLGFVFSKIPWESVHTSPDRYHLTFAISCALKLLHLSSDWYLFP